MQPKPVSPFLQAWFKWKALRLPWRKRFLVGFDLHGNSYWQFRDIRGSEGRWRRIVKYPSRTHHGDVKVSPQWHQWLRHTREEPPSLEEQRGDVLRRERMKYLAAEADARWEAKPRVMEAPAQAAVGISQPAQALGTDAPQPTSQAVGQQSESSQDAQTPDAAGETGSREETWRKMQKARSSPGHDPWKQAQRGGPSGQWQPEGWNPSATSKRP